MKKIVSSLLLLALLLPQARLHAQQLHKITFTPQWTAQSQFAGYYIALGMMDGMVFQGESIDNIREWQFLAYTDGLNEAENPEYELFGNDRLIEIMDTLGSENSATVIRVLQEEVEKHRNGATPSDDLTLLCLRLTKNKK